MIIGIDPGITGACAVITDLGEFKTVIDIPTSAKITGKGNEIEAAALARWLRGWVSDYSPDLKAYVERVQAMPGQGVTSMFGFGYTAGTIRGVITALEIPLVYVLPQAWKKHFSITGKDKDAARTLAIQRFPDAAKYLERKKDIGRADALLIALYGWEQKYTARPADGKKVVIGADTYLK